MTIKIFQKPLEQVLEGLRKATYTTPEKPYYFYKHKIDIDLCAYCYKQNDTLLASMNFEYVTTFVKSLAVKPRFSVVRDL